MRLKKRCLLFNLGGMSKKEKKLSGFWTRTLITELFQQNRKRKRQTKHGGFTFKMHQYFSLVIKFR